MTKRGNNGGTRGQGQGGNRQLFTRVKTAKGRKMSSKLWLERQLNDPYVTRAKDDGYRSRAAYKLIEIDDKYGFLTKGKHVIDLGAAPGGWTQVAVERVRAGKSGGGTVVGIDLLEMTAIPGATLIQHDFMADDAPALLAEAMKGNQADVVLSDMAASSCGHRATDHARIIALCETAFDFARQHLAKGGAFVAKVLQGGTERELLALLKQHFSEVRHVKPPASRADSAEMYLVALGFKGE